ncbi:RNA polymerase sigma factor [Mucilaginibacter paludis]|uniref:RNA polymerase, sigma-24 subunit, ECF subfamily n=1 Tax=Mucilaginibacter paludis DSM 18603 TaxID=714943 RepID=H1Y4H9_9SPHI|nr:sigma-70 family RNA polymerase sigma factor [Mucilaginibacter paludis]EHQ26763.1 RNA polymerase, sigma-24 subunit, ECF subfamily [Mucilaginibacter paludis DSM 18603]
MKFLKSSRKPVEADDDTLLRNYRETGDLAVLARLYERYMSLVYGVCLKYLKDEELSKDAVMQIFEELLAKVNRYDIKQFKSWLYTLSRNYCLMQLRSEKKWEQESLDGVMELAVDLHPEYEALQDDLAALERCKEKLPPAQKLTVNMFYLDEKCYKEIAEHTGYSLNEVKSYIQNGKRNLKICLEKNRER